MADILVRSVPKHRRQCLYGSPFPCNGGCFTNGDCQPAEGLRGQLRHLFVVMAGGVR